MSPRSGAGEAQQRPARLSINRSHHPSTDSGQLQVWVDIPVHADFTLHGLWPNPAVDDLVVSFSLPGAGPATLEVFDVAGRRLVARDVGSLGPGGHRWNLSRDAHLSAGTYILRLTQGDRRAVVRAMVLR